MGGALSSYDVNCKKRVLSFLRINVLLCHIRRSQVQMCAESLISFDLYMPYVSSRSSCVIPDNVVINSSCADQFFKMCNTNLIAMTAHQQYTFLELYS